MKELSLLLCGSLARDMVSCWGDKMNVFSVLTLSC